VPVEEGALGGTAVLGSDQRKEVVSWPMSLPTAWLAAPIDGGIGGRRTGLEMTPQRIRVVWRQCMPYAGEEASGRLTMAPVTGSGATLTWCRLARMQRSGEQGEVEEQLGVLGDDGDDLHVGRTWQWSDEL
jgi:hypothetical protein